MIRRHRPTRPKLILPIPAVSTAEALFWAVVHKAKDETRPDAKPVTAHRQMSDAIDAALERMRIGSRVPANDRETLIHYALRGSKPDATLPTEEAASEVWTRVMHTIGSAIAAAQQVK